MALCHNCDDTRIEYTGAVDQTDYTFPFEYYKTEDVKVANWDDALKVWVDQPKTIEPSTTVWVLQNETTIRFTTAPVGQKFIIYRCTDLEPLPSTFYPGTAIKAQDLNDNFFVLKSAIEEAHCSIQRSAEASDDKYWNKIDYGAGGDTVYSNDVSVKNDTSIYTSGAVGERLDPFFQSTTPTYIPGDFRLPGKLWFDTSNSTTKVWDSANTTWVDLSGNFTTIVSEVAPATRTSGSSLVSGDVWFNSSSGELFVWYDDGDPQNSRGRQWVQAVGAAGPTGEVALDKLLSEDPIVIEKDTVSKTANWYLNINLLPHCTSSNNLTNPTTSSGQYQRDEDCWLTDGDGTLYLYTDGYQVGSDPDGWLEHGPAREILSITQDPDVSMGNSRPTTIKYKYGTDGAISTFVYNAPDGEPWAQIRDATCIGNNLTGIDTQRTQDCWRTTSQGELWAHSGENAVGSVDGWVFVGYAVQILSVELDGNGNVDGTQGATITYIDDFGNDPTIWLGGLVINEPWAQIRNATCATFAVEAPSGTYTIPDDGGNGGLRTWVIDPAYFIESTGYCRTDINWCLDPNQGEYAGTDFSFVGSNPIITLNTGEIIYNTNVTTNLTYVPYVEVEYTDPFGAQQTLSPLISQDGLLFQEGTVQQTVDYVTPAVTRHFSIIESIKVYEDAQPVVDVEVPEGLRASPNLIWDFREITPRDTIT